MAYTSGDTILDDHYNDFRTSVNAVWGVGVNDSGYGQTNTVASVSVGTTITATQWTTLLARITSAANHQNSSITSISDPSAGDSISAYTALSTNISTITTNRLNVHGRDAVVESSASTTTTLQGNITQEGNWAWGSNDQARYFFNAGGRVSVRWDIAGYTADTKANEWNALLAAAGTFYVYAQSSGKSGGSGTTSTNDTDAGWHDLTGSYEPVFKQFFDTTSYTPYGINYVQLDMYKNTTGTVFWRTQMVDAAADQTSYNKSIYNVLDQVDGTKYTYFGHEEPTTTYIADSWGDGPTQTVTANG